MCAPNAQSNLEVCSEVGIFSCTICYMFFTRPNEKLDLVTTVCMDSTGLFDLIRRGRTLFATQEIQGYCCSLVASALQAARGLANSAQTATLRLANILFCAYLIGWFEWDVSSNWFFAQRSPCTCST